jgi:DNA-binding CsgD family transcriptional regulator
VRALTLQEEALALAEQQQDRVAIAQAFTYLGTRAVYAGETTESTRLLSEARHRWEALGDTFFLGLTLNFLGSAALAEGDQVEAAALKAAALGHLETSGGMGFAGAAHLALAAIVGQQGNVCQAIQHVRAGIEASLALRDRRLLSSGARAALMLMDEHVGLERRIRLLGASDVLSQTTGGIVVSERESASRAMPQLRERLERGEWAAAYREGCALQFTQVAALALGLLDEVDQWGAAPDKQHMTSQQHEQPARQTSLLTEREQEVLRLVAAGLSSKAIGQQLFLSPSTVNHHIKSIVDKLGADTRAQAVAVAAQRGLL